MYQNTSFNTNNLRNFWAQPPSEILPLVGKRHLPHISALKCAPPPPPYN